MTKAEAYKVLGAGRCTGQSKVEHLYREKCRKLRLQMVPGMPLPARQRAQGELARLNVAWQIVAASSPAKSATSTKTARPQHVDVVPYGDPRTLGEAWGRVASGMPIPAPVIGIAVIVAVLMAIVSLFKHR